MDPYKSVYGINFEVATELLPLTDNIFSVNVCSCLERKAAVQPPAEIGFSIKAIMGTVRRKSAQRSHPESDQRLSSNSNNGGITRYGMFAIGLGRSMQYSGKGQ